MAFSKPERQPPEQQPPERQPKAPASGPRLGRFAAGVIRALLRLTFGVATVVVVVAGLLYLRLSQGPIHLPFVAHFAAQVFNDDTDRLQLELGDLVLTMGEAGAPAGVQFIDLRVKNADGETLFTVPRLAAKFDPSDLLRGDLRPTQIVLIRRIGRAHV